ncbi:glycosyltransferase [Salegentibacter salegens]|uniref:glycosyltransferase n=1 Tax=Salegentibacter salegens TaxID=143223 RepID=UPI000D452943|nr:glycosyltransferase [Salegentibacter salegens]PRX46303.1 glycosyl transferase family 2 [Salegentibacter salegens]
MDSKKFLQFLSQNEYHFCFVNDGSEDRTYDLIVAIQDAFPDKVTIVNLSRNRGKGEAVRQGFLDAEATGKFDYIGYFDADLATPLEEISYLKGYFQKDYKIIIGSRVKRLGAEITRNSLRHYLGRVFATVASIHLGIKVYDSQCGAKIFSCDMAKILFKEEFVTKWLFDLELIYRLKKYSPSDFEKDILEVPLRIWKEKKNSKMKVIDFILAPFDLYKIKKASS